MFAALDVDVIEMGTVCSEFSEDLICDDRQPRYINMLQIVTVIYDCMDHRHIHLRTIPSAILNIKCNFCITSGVFHLNPAVAGSNSFRGMFRH